MNPLEFNFNIERPCSLAHVNESLLYSCEKPKLLIGPLSEANESGEYDFFRCKPGGVRARNYILNMWKEDEIHASCTPKVVNFYPVNCSTEKGALDASSTDEFTRRLTSSYLKMIGEGCVDKRDVQFEDDIVYAIALRRIVGFVPVLDSPDEIGKIVIEDLPIENVNFGLNLNYGELKKIVKETCEDISSVTNSNLSFNKERRKYLLANILKLRKFNREVNKIGSATLPFKYFISYGLKLMAGSYRMSYLSGECRCKSIYFKGDRAIIKNFSFNVPQKLQTSYNYFSKMVVINSGLCDPF